jgi:hypothetical protein
VAEHALDTAMLYTREINDNSLLPPIGVFTLAHVVAFLVGPGATNQSSGPCGAWAAVVLFNSRDRGPRLTAAE